MLPRLTVSRGAAALSAVLLLSLTACGGGDDESAASGGSSPESGVPAYADNPGQAGAEQFVGYWTDTLNEATTSGDTEQLKSLAGNDCRTCGDFASQLDEIYAAGGHVESDGWEVDRVVAEAGNTEDEVGLFVTFQVSPQTVFASEDADAQEFEGGNQGFRFHLVREDGAWQVQDLTPR